MDETKAVLRLRLQLLQARLEGADASAELGAKLLQTLGDLKVASPETLSLMCDVAVDMGDVAQMNRVSDFFIASFDGSDALWHAYRARTFAKLAEKDYKGALASIDEAQGLFGADSFMGWAQINKASILYEMGSFNEAEEAYNMVINVPAWRGDVISAEATYGIGKCRLGRGELEGAHAFFQRTYLLYKAYANGDWAAKGYLAAADCLVKLGRKEGAIKTLKEMLGNEYTSTNALADQARKQLTSLGE
jgi:TolA-binding protein